ncbi:hypothetical protein [Legionella wadsworthii]|nr:hypothetical protein [Legionella wadsworthii]
MICKPGLLNIGFIPFKTEAYEMSLFLKFGLFGSGIGSLVGLGAGAYYGGALCAVGGAACGIILGPPALLIVAMAVGAVCLAVGGCCYLGLQLMKALFAGTVVAAQDTLECCIP